MISSPGAVFVYLACAFRYGSDDLDVIGLSFRRDIWINRTQVYPPTGDSAVKTPMQESLMKKVGEQGCPFTFQVRELSATDHSSFIQSVVHLKRFFFICFRCQQISHAQWPCSLGQMMLERYNYCFFVHSYTSQYMSDRHCIWVLFCCRLVVWTLRSKHTLPTKLTTQMKSLRRSESEQTFKLTL